jgi:hypothetical protein
MAHWLYPVNPDSNYVLIDDETGDEVPVTVENLRKAVERNAGWDTWVLNTGFRKMRPGDQVWIYFGVPVQALVALGTAEAIYRDDEGWHVDLSWNVTATRLLEAHPISQADLGGVPQAAMRPSAIAVKTIDAWLASANGVTPAQDPRAEPMSAEDAREKVLAEIYRRRGQMRFRNSLLDAFDGKCAITGCTERQVLEAAHIRPYRGEHTNMPGNGLLLRADIHALFDLNLIAINPKGRVWVSPSLKEPLYSGLAGARLRPVTNKKWQPRAELLKEHYDECQ